MGFCNCSMFCCALFYVLSSFANVLMGKRELVALLSWSSWCLVIVVWLFLAVPWVGLQCVIVVFPDQTHLYLFSEGDTYFSKERNCIKSSKNQRYFKFVINKMHEISLVLFYLQHGW